MDIFRGLSFSSLNLFLGAKLSEHGRGNALDIRALRLADGRAVELTDPQVPKDFREGLRQSVCARFTTVLGPGSDGYHEDHVHVDLAEPGWKPIRIVELDFAADESATA